MNEIEKDTGKFAESENAGRDENSGRGDLGNSFAPKPAPQPLVAAQPVLARPVSAQPVTAKPISTQPTTAQPVKAQPAIAQQQTPAALGAAHAVPQRPTAPPEPGGSLPSNGFIFEGEQTKIAKLLDWLAINKMKCIGLISGLLLIAMYIFLVHPRIFDNSNATRDAAVAPSTKTGGSGASMDGPSSIAAFCPEKVLESGNKVAGVYKGIDCGDFCYATITLDSGEDVYLLCDEEKWEKHFGTPGNRVSVDYDLIQYLDEGGQYCARNEFVTGVRLLAAGGVPATGAPQEAVAINEAPVRSGGTFTNSLGLEFVLIPAGSFSGSWPGKNDFGENVIHQQVRIISKPFYLGKYEVTQEQWVAVMGEGSNPSSTKVRNHPVTDVSWNDVQAFIQRLNQNESSGQYRLPTEAEWEYAARAGTDTEWFFGDDPADLGEYAWYADNSGEKDDFGNVVIYPKTRPIGQNKPNPWGLHDIYGNAEEWVQDWYDVETNKPGSRRGWYKPGEVIDPAGPNEPPPYGLHVVRGRHYSAFLESHERGWSSLRRGGSYNGNEKTGFRLVFSPGAPQQ
jgi:Uncharacterized conserved protein